MRVICKFPGGMADGGWCAAGVRRSVERSLTAMRRDHVDVVLLHSPPLEVLESTDVLDALVAVRDAGLANEIGLAGEGDELAWAVASRRCDAIQTSVNLVDQRVLDLTVPTAKAAGQTVFAKRALANGAWPRPDRGSGPYSGEYRRRFDACSLDPPDGDWLELAARFSAFAPGVDVAFFSTTSRVHRDAVVAAVRRGPLDEAVVTRMAFLRRAAS